MPLGMVCGKDEIATTCGFDISGSYPALMRKLQEAFRSQAKDDGLRPVLMIDESQDLRPEVLATFRVLTNFEMDSRLVVSLVLAGDTRLRSLLDRAEVEPIRRRLAHFATLRLLSRAETDEYMHHCPTACASPPLTSSPSTPKPSMPSMESPEAISALLTTSPASVSNWPHGRPSLSSMPLSLLRLGKSCCCKETNHEPNLGHSP